MQEYAHEIVAGLMATLVCGCFSLAFKIAWKTFVSQVEKAVQEAVSPLRDDVESISKALSERGIIVNGARKELERKRL